jgi:hypothetical protein
MYQPWLFGTMMAAGTGLVAATVTLQRQPAPEPVLVVPAEPAVHVIPPPSAATVAEPAATERVLQMEPVVIEARHRRPTPAATAEPEPAPAERPCSTWRDLGPMHVVAGKPSGDLQVRELCM